MASPTPQLDTFNPSGTHGFASSNSGYYSVHYLYTIMPRRRNKQVSARMSVGLLLNLGSLYSPNKPEDTAYASLKEKLG